MKFRLISMNGRLWNRVLLVFLLWNCSSVYCSAAIIYPQAPPASRDVAYQSLQQPDVQQFLMTSNIADLKIGQPYAGYMLVNIHDVRSDRLLSVSEMYCWNYPVIRGIDTVRVMELDSKEENGFKLIRSESYGDSISLALRNAEILQKVKDHDYEFRFLRIAAIPYSAVWLHNRSDDIIVPLPPIWGHWEPYRPYSEAEMVKLLKAEVVQRIPR